MVTYSAIKILPETTTKKEFLSYVNNHNPVIVKNGLNIKNRWSLNFLEKNYAENEVTVRINTSSKEYRNGTDYKIKSTTLGRYITDLKNKTKKSQNSYLAVQNLKFTFPKLWADPENFQLPEFLQNENLHSGPFLWIARPGHYEYMHVDPDEGLLMICSGSKTVKLFSYDQFHLMKPHKLGSFGRTVQSGLDLKIEDNSEQLPNDKICYTGNIKSGDMLYIPAFYWHQITTDINDNQPTISLNSFWSPCSENQLFADKILKNNNQLYKIFVYWFSNVLEQNKSFPTFNRMLSRFDEVAYNFILKQWKEKISVEHVEILCKICLDYFELEKFPDRAVDDVSKHPPVLKIRGLTNRVGKD